MSNKHKSTSPNAIQVKYQWKTIGIEEKLTTISQLEKGERLGAISHNVRSAHFGVSKICDNADTVTEIAKSGTKVFVYQ